MATDGLSLGTVKEQYVTPALYFPYNTRVDINGEVLEVIGHLMHRAGEVALLLPRLLLMSRGWYFIQSWRKHVAG